LLTYIGGREGGIEFTGMLLVARTEVTLKVRFSDKVVGLTKLNKTQRLDGLLHAFLILMSCSL